MHIEQALMVSPAKQAIRNDGQGQMVIVTQLQSEGYSVSAIAGASVFLQTSVPNEQAVEQVLWDHLCMSGIGFEPVQTLYTASPFRSWADEPIFPPIAARLDHFPLASIPSPPVAGKPVTLIYDGRLGERTDRLTMHWGYNSWNRITDTPMTRERDGIWQVTLTVPPDATVLNMAFHDQNDTWDNHQQSDYHLEVQKCLTQDGPRDDLSPTHHSQEQHPRLPEREGTLSSSLTKRSLSRRAVLIGLGALTTIIAGTAIGTRWYNWKVSSDRTLLTYRGHTMAVEAVAWSPDGKRLASSDNWTVQIWDAFDGHTLLTYRGHPTIEESVEAVTWSPDGKCLASASESMVQIWDSTDGHPVLTYRGHSGVGNTEAWSPWAVAWSPDGKRLASAYLDGTVQVWNAADGSTVLIYRGHASAVSAVAWSPDGKRLASASDDQTVQIWDATDGHPIFTYRGHSDMVTAVVWSPDGKHLASASLDTTVLVWRAP